MTISNQILESVISSGEWEISTNMIITRVDQGGSTQYVAYVFESGGILNVYYEATKNNIIQAVNNSSGDDVLQIQN